MYLHRQNVQNIMVEGIGQPVISISGEFIEKAEGYDRVWLVVNSHRQEMNLEQQPKAVLLAEYPRPAGGPSLQVWDITRLLRN